MSETETPTPTPTPTTAAWTIAFGGDCDRMVTPAQRESILGGANRSMDDVAAESPSEVAQEFPRATPGAEGTAGGLRCDWIEGSSGLEQLRWMLFALPSALVDPATVTAFAEPTCAWNYDAQTCRLGATVGDLWILAAAVPMLMDEEAPTETLTALIEAARANAASSPAPVPDPATAQRWPIVACAELGERMHLTEVLGEGYWSGRSEGSRQPEDDLYEHAGVRQFCQFGPDESVSGKIGLVTMTTAPGGAWIWSSADDAVGEVVSLAGAEQARRIVGPGAIRDRDTVRATDGTNLIDVWAVGEGVTAPDIVARAIAALRQD